MSATDIKSELERRWGDDPVALVCVKIVDFIASLPAEERQLLTYATFMKATNKPVPDAELATAIGILVNSKIAALDTWAMYTDELGEDFELTPQELSTVQANKELIHPETGEPVPDYENYLVPFFVPTERLAG